MTVKGITSMQNFKLLVYFFFSFAFAALLWSAGVIVLAKLPTVYIPFTRDFHYYRINLTSLFFQNNLTTSQTPLDAQKLNIKLKAIYKNGKTGFIIIEDHHKIYFINLHESYKGYKLIAIYPQAALFIKNGKKYKIEFQKKSVKYNATYNDDVAITIPKQTFLTYKNDLAKIAQTIHIIQTPQGYKITYVKKGSIFEKLGLKKGDIITKVNGKVLRNDADAWDIYKHTDKIHSYDITIIRNNHKKDLHYEVD